MTPLFFWKFSQDYRKSHKNTHVMCFLGLKIVVLNYFVSNRGVLRWFISTLHKPAGWFGPPCILFILANFNHLN